MHWMRIIPISKALVESRSLCLHVGSPVQLGWLHRQEGKITRLCSSVQWHRAYMSYITLILGQGTEDESRVLACTAPNLKDTEGQRDDLSHFAFLQSGHHGVIKDHNDRSLAFALCNIY